jgi:chromosome segregation ATPase
LKQNATLQSELTALKQMPGFEEHKSTVRSGSFGKIDGREYLISAHSCKGTQTEPYIDVQDSDKVCKECRRNFEVEFQEKILKLITFEIPKGYFGFNNNNNNGNVPLGTVEALVKMCVECKWQRDTLERKVAELVKELQDAKHMCELHNKVADELDCEYRMLKGNVETCIEEVILRKSGGGEVLAPIPENNEEAEAMEQKIVTLENEIEVLREARSNLEADAKGLREEGQVLVKRLQTVNAMLRNQENLETEVSRWQKAAADADGQLKEALAAKSCLEEEVGRLHKELQNLEAKNQHQVFSRQRTLEELQEEVIQLRERLLDQEVLQKQKEALMNAVTDTQNQLHLCDLGKSKLKDEVKELQKQVEDMNAQGLLQTEVENLQQQLLETQQAKELYLVVQEQLTAKARQLEDATQKISEYEQHAQDLSEQLKNCEQNLDNLNVKLVNTETQLSEVLNTKVSMQKELGYVQEELGEKLKEISKLKDEKTLMEQNLMRIVSDKSNAESKYEDLLSELNAKDVEIQNLKKVKLELEQETERLHSARAELEYEGLCLQTTAVEANRWKEMAEASERQLSEALQVRDELEQECKRLYLIETQVQNQEHLHRELEQLKKLSEEMEQSANQLLTDKLSLEQQCADMKDKLHDLEDMEKEAKERAASAEQQLGVVLHNKNELETKCQMMHTVEEKFKNLEKDFVRQKELSFSLHQELSEVVSAKCELEAECRRLLAVERKLRNQDSLELELNELRRKLVAVEQELSEVVTAKLQLEDSYKKMETMYKLLKSEVTTQKGEGGSTEECQTFNTQSVLKAMEQQIRSLESEQQKLIFVQDKKTCENDILQADNSRFLQMISEQVPVAVKHEEECQFQGNEAIQMAKETIANLSKIIMDKDMEIEALNRDKETLLHNNDSNSNSEEFIKFKEAVSEQLSRLSSERAELIRTVKVKHEESVQYHSEIQRLTGLLSQEMKKLEEMKHQHNILAQQYEEKQKLILNMQTDLAAAKLRIQQLEMGQMNSAADADAAQRLSEVVQRHAEQQERENKIQMLYSQVADLQDQLMHMGLQKHAEPAPPTHNKVRCNIRI